MLIDKTDEMIELLENRFYYNGYISPSGVKDYMDCSLRFYYKYKIWSLEAWVLYGSREKKNHWPWATTTAPLGYRQRYQVVASLTVGVIG